MNTWTDNAKCQSRIDTLPTHVEGQYWTLAGLCDGPSCEADYMLQFLEPEQFHGVERDRTIFEQNVENYPQLNWHHGDLVQVMRQQRGFNPGFVNADLIQGVERSAPMVAQLIDLLKSFDCKLNINFVLSSRNRPPQTAEHVINVLSRYPLIRNAIRRGWSFGPRHYVYKRHTTVMGTFFFHREEMRLAA